MNVQLPLRMDKAAFLDWVQGREGRFELVNGRTIMMVGASRTHGLIVSNLMAILRGQLDPREWSVIADFGLDAGPETLRYPDIVVDPAAGSGGDFTATAPELVIEVLSPSSERIDLGDKAAERSETHRERRGYGLLPSNNRVSSRRASTLATRRR
jgi:Uma2 family endonuclease